MFLSASNANTLLTVNLVDAVVNNNGSNVFAGDGINGTVLSGARLDLEGSSSISTTSFNGNKGDGIDIFVSGVSSRADVDLHNVTVGTTGSGNTLNGFQFQSLDGGEFNLQAYQTAFNSNGGAGLSGTVTNTAGVDTIGRIRIVGGSADSNTGSGFDLQGSNTTGGPTGIATLTAMFQADDLGAGISAQNNGGFGLNFVTTSTVQSTPTAGTVGNLLMTGPSTLNGNTSGTVNISMNKALQAIVGLSGTFDGSSGDGIGINLTNISDLALVSLQGPGEVKGNAGNGINVNLQNAHNGVVFIGGFTDVSNNGLDGIKVTMDNVGANFGAGTGHGALTINGTTTAVPGNTMNVSNNGGNGVNVNFINGSIIDNSFAPAILSGVSNQVSLIVNNGNLNPATNLLPPPPLPVVPLLPAGQPMLTTQLQNVSTPLGLTFGPTVSIENVNANSNGTTVATANGLTITGTGATTSIAGSILVQNDSFTNTGTGTSNNGIQLNLSNGVIASGMNVLSTTISGNKGDGFQMLSPWYNNTGSPASPAFALNFTGDVIDTNGQNGVDLVLPNSNMLTATISASFTNVDASTNTLNGLLLEAGNQPTDNVSATVSINSSATANTLNGQTRSTFNSNGGMGAFLTSSAAFPTNLSTIGLTIGGAGGQNQFNSNKDAGVGINLAGETIGTATVSNASFNSTTNSGKYNNFNSTGINPFAGDGFAVFVQGTTDNTVRAQFNNATLGDATLNNTNFNNNAAGAGVRVSTILSGTVNPSGGGGVMKIQHSTMTGNRDGINFVRDAGIIAPGPYVTGVLIDNNTISTNTRDGVSLTSAFADGADGYTITNNTITNNSQNGINLRTVADADMTVFIGQNAAGVAGANLISNNTLDGIRETATVNATDVSVFTGTITNNTITLNKNDGINITGRHHLLVGTPDGVTKASNLINNNTNDGIFIRANSNAQTDQIQFNTINNNGGNGISIQPDGTISINIANNIHTVSTIGGQFGGINNNGGAGIQLVSDTTLSAGNVALNATIDSNDVLHSTSDGIRFLANAPGSATSTNSVSISNSFVQFSGFRGINVLNAANAGSDVVITGSQVTNSQFEGIYMVNTSTGGQLGNAVGGATQSIDAGANSAMAVSSTWFNTPNLATRVTNNIITSNGQVILTNPAANLYDTTGLVIRVGSSGSSGNFNDPGGFASNLGAGNYANGANYTLANMTATGGRGGVLADVETNTFGGNAGVDVTFQAFKSTTDPTTTSGTWQNILANTPAAVFNVGTYVSDPLSRLDLRFVNNTGNGLAATRADVFSSTNPAFYNNAESIFKSRTNPSPTANDVAGGPFGSGSRDRNLTRQASQLNTPGAGNGVASEAANGFLYPGTGLSTFREVQSGNVFGSQALGFGGTIPNPTGNTPGTQSFAWDLLP